MLQTLGNIGSKGRHYGYFPASSLLKVTHIFNLLKITCFFPSTYFMLTNFGGGWAYYFLYDRHLFFFLFFFLQFFSVENLLVLFCCYNKSIFSQFYRMHPKGDLLGNLWTVLFNMLKERICFLVFFPVSDVTCLSVSSLVLSRVTGWVRPRWSAGENAYMLDISYSAMLLVQSR